MLHQRSNLQVSIGNDVHLWNSLPEQLRQPDITFGQFKRSLKTFMFGWLVCGALCLNVKGAD